MKRSDIPTEVVLWSCVLAHSNLSTKNSLEMLISATGAPDKVALAAMEREDNKGLIDYGVSLRTAFITDEGMEFLNRNSITLEYNEKK